MSKTTTEGSTKMETQTLKVGDQVKTLIAPPHPAAFAGKITGIAAAGDGRHERAQVRNDTGEYRIITLQSLVKA